MIGFLSSVVIGVVLTLLWSNDVRALRRERDEWERRTRVLNTAIHKALDGEWDDVHRLLKENMPR